PHVRRGERAHDVRWVSRADRVRDLRVVDRADDLHVHVRVLRVVLGDDALELLQLACAPAHPDGDRRSLLRRLRPGASRSLRAGAPISRAEISRQAGISKPTVSLALQSLLDAELVRETVHDPGRPTYGAVYFEPVPDAALVLGFDLGARFLRGAVCDLRGQILARQDVELRRPGAEPALEAMRTLAPSLLETTDKPLDLIDGCVVGVPGVVDAETRMISLALNVPGLEERPFVTE